MGFAAVAAPIVLRNVLLTGRPTGAFRGPSTISFLTNATIAARVLLDQWPAGPTARGGPWPGAMASLLLLGAFAWWLVRHREASAWLVQDRRFLLWAWPLGYASYMVLQRSVMHFDFLGARLLAPALLFVPCLAAVALRAMVPLGAPILLAAFTAVAVVRGGQFAGAIQATRPPEEPRPGRTPNGSATSRSGPRSATS